MDFENAKEILTRFNGGKTVRHDSLNEAACTVACSDTGAQELFFAVKSGVSQYLSQETLEEMFLCLAANRNVNSARVLNELIDEGSLKRATPEVVQTILVDLGLTDIVWSKNALMKAFKAGVFDGEVGFVKLATSNGSAANEFKGLFTGDSSSDNAKLVAIVFNGNIVSGINPSENLRRELARNPEYFELNQQSPQPSVLQRA